MVEVAGVFKADLRRVMKELGINNQQDTHQRLLTNLIGADFETQTWILRCVATPYEITDKVSREFYEKSLADIQRDPVYEIVTP